MGSHREHGEHRGKTVRDSFLSEKEKTCQTKVRRSQRFTKNTVPTEGTEKNW
jgi:hypothetical protein